MRGPVWLPMLLVLACGGCMLPCAGGSCQPGPAGSMAGCSTAGCATGECKPGLMLSWAKHCPGLDDWVTTQTAMKCARSQLWQMQWQSKCTFSKDFEAGFIQAWVDLSQGGTGETPAVAPSRYWSAWYRSGEGHQKADEWFNGYRNGAQTGRSQLHALRQIAASGEWMAPSQRPEFQPARNGACLDGSCGVRSTPFAGEVAPAWPSPAMLPAPPVASPSPTAPFPYGPSPEPSWIPAPSGSMTGAGFIPGYSPFAMPQNGLPVPSTGSTLVPMPPRSSGPEPVAPGPVSSAPTPAMTASPAAPLRNHTAPPASLAPGYSSDAPGTGVPDHILNDPPVWRVAPPMN